MLKILILLIFTFSFKTYGVDISSVEFICPEENNCDQLRDSLKSLRRNYIDIDHLADTIKIYVANEGVKNLSYELVKKDENYSLRFVMEQKQRIVDVAEVAFERNRGIELPSILPLKRDDFLDLRRVEQTSSLIKEIAKEKGYPNTTVNISFQDKKRGVLVKINVDLKEPVWVKKINISSGSIFLKDKLQTIIGEYYNKPFDSQSIKADLEDARKLFLQFGYYLNEIELKTKNLTSNKVVLFINIKNTRTYTFHIKSSSFDAPENIKKYLSNSIIGFKREMTEENVSGALKDYFRGLGIRGVEIEVKKRKVITARKEVNIQYDIEVKEGGRVKLADVAFKGNTHFTDEELNKLFYKNASSLISAGIHDERYYDSFLKLLREEFIKKGFVSVFIDKPFVKYEKEKQEVIVTFRIREGIQSKIVEYNLNGIPEELKEKIRPLLSHTVGKFFNPLKFEEELVLIQDYLKNEGFYFTKITNLNTNSLVTYYEDNSQVKIDLNIDLGRKLFVGDIIIIGNNQTRKILIKRELRFKPRDLVTIKSIEQSQVALLSLGIFNSVQIQPVNNQRSKTDILVFVREKDFGTIEIAPGIRSDLGLKISSVVNYNNIDGMNKKITFKGSVNQRFHLNSLDDTRRRTSSSLVEYSTEVNYSENYIFHSNFDFSTQISKARRRFFSFDADIQRFNLRLSRDFTRWFQSSIKYQIETISQFDATVDREHGHFQIGSITPAVSFDFRDRPINPTAGAFFNLSCEFANPALLSQQNDELTINYYKLISRNRFYVPMSRDVVIAMSAAFGIQENLANGVNEDGSSEGYIPNIKVFRLIGADFVRGYEDNEINRVSTLQDISEVEINKRAYMANIKFEPRLMLSDSTILGVFYDAGRIFVDEFKQDELRSAVGLSFKYLTPVGTLDFDYGIKLLRKRDENGNLDSPGRLHVSIGFF